MEGKNKKIHIVGAGVSGLVAAKTLEAGGLEPIILETTDRLGGRVKTDVIDGVPFDHGFQVLLTAYPQVQKHLDIKALKLNYFKPGALLFKDGKQQRIGDPLRDISALWPTLVSSAGSVSDKIKIFTLSRKLKRKSIEAIFKTSEKTTQEYLMDYGFSPKIIQNFFKPFFTGIFLEDELRTSSRMFEFVFKMFSEGHAAIPKDGIGAIPLHLASQLVSTTIEYGKSIEKVDERQLRLSNETVIESDAVITTVPITSEGNANSAIKWKSCHNLYFEVKEQTFPTGIIGLICDETTLTNNLHFLFDTQKPILSVTVVKNHQLTDQHLAEQVKNELLQHCGITTERLLRHYHIPKALPDVREVQMQPESIHDSGVFMAGDITLNGSLHAAMLSGEHAAEEIIRRNIDAF